MLADDIAGIRYNRASVGARSAVDLSVGGNEHENRIQVKREDCLK